MLFNVILYLHVTFVLVMYCSIIFRSLTFNFLFFSVWLMQNVDSVLHQSVLLKCPRLSPFHQGLRRNRKADILMFGGSMTMEVSSCKVHVYAMIVHVCYEVDSTRHAHYYCNHGTILNKEATPFSMFTVCKIEALQQCYTKTTTLTCTCLYCVPLLQ